MDLPTLRPARGITADGEGGGGEAAPEEGVTDVHVRVVLGIRLANRKVLKKV